MGRRARHHRHLPPGGPGRQRQLWYAGVGFDPDLVPEEWWRLYGDATDGVVAPADLPDGRVPGSLARFDLEAMKVAEVCTYADGAFPSPPDVRAPRRRRPSPTTATSSWSCTATAPRRCRSSTPPTSRPARWPGATAPGSTPPAAALVLDARPRRPPPQPLPRARRPRHQGRPPGHARRPRRDVRAWARPPPEPPSTADRSGRPRSVEEAVEELVEQGVLGVGGRSRGRAAAPVVRPWVALQRARAVSSGSPVARSPSRAASSTAARA